MHLGKTQHGCGQHPIWGRGSSDDRLASSLFEIDLNEDGCVEKEHYSLSSITIWDAGFPLVTIGLKNLRLEGFLAKRRCPSTSRRLRRSSMPSGFSSSGLGGDKCATVFPRSVTIIV